MKNISLSPRLFAAAHLCVGDFIADVGTDHGFLPIYLVQSGKAARAVASDIRPEPLSNARENIEKHGLSDKIDAVLADGLAGLEKYPLTDVVIAGMGGMNIIRILDGADFLREKCVGLVLQPMQNIPELAEYLARSGYCIKREILAVDGGKPYRIISAVYDGEVRSYTPDELMLGAYNIAHKSEQPREFCALCDKFINTMKKKVNGLEASGKDAGCEREVLARLEAYRKEV